MLRTLGSFKVISCFELGWILKFSTNSSWLNSHENSCSSVLLIIETSFHQHPSYIAEIREMMSNLFVQTKLCIIEGKFEVSSFFLRNVIFFISFPPIRDFHLCVLNPVCSSTFWSCISSKHAKVDAISQGKWQQVLGLESGQVPRKTVKKNATILKSEFQCEGKKRNQIFELLNFF